MLHRGLDKLLMAWIVAVVASWITICFAVNVFSSLHYEVLGMVVDLKLTPKGSCSCICASISSWGITYNAMRNLDLSNNA